ncbi:hypothetical protein MWU61_11880 [Loktanella sp. F6476L]|uniref:hypothetical protein n=1 Tax=Loktanella sp. F6476L TaxID=2926405 RepID=UPI001FF25AF3|nr:hypothetical protein [Loktanella sp. F6476L]MCK0121242.1 hypothetical protein [Loktanella sp. F6476L]
MGDSDKKCLFLHFFQNCLLIDFTVFFSFLRYVRGNRKVTSHEIHFRFARLINQSATGGDEMKLTISKGAATPFPEIEGDFLDRLTRSTDDILKGRSNDDDENSEKKAHNVNGPVSRTIRALKRVVSHTEYQITPTLRLIVSHRVPMGARSA